MSKKVGPKKAYGWKILKAKKALKQKHRIKSNAFNLIFGRSDKKIIIKARPKVTALILDAGCGRGFYLRAISLYDFPQEIYGIDTNKIYLVKARQSCNDKRVRLKEISIYDTKYPSNFFDFIICSEVLEHLDDDRKALVELKRILKSNGSLIITVPNYNFPFLWDPFNWILMRFFKTHINKSIWWLAGIWADHKRLYTKEDIANKVKEYFKIADQKLFLYWCWPFSHFLLYGIGKNIVEKLGWADFNRFNFISEKTFSRLVAYVIRLPSQFLDKLSKTNSAVNICIRAKNKYKFK